MCRRSMGRPYRRASRTNSITSPPRCLDLWNWRRNKQSRTRRCSSVLGEIPITSGSVDFIWEARPSVSALEPFNISNAKLFKLLPVPQPAIMDKFAIIAIIFFSLATAYA